VRRFNKTHHRRGHLFEGRYKAIVCDRDSFFWNWSVTFISTRLEPQWSRRLVSGVGAGTRNT
jgi:hypothetical protein